MSLQKNLLKLSNWYSGFYWRKFDRCLSRPQKVQAQTLKHILKISQITQAEFEALPVRSYEDFEAQIEMARARPGSACLTKQAVNTYEPTSGSSGSKKWIPYPRDLLLSFTDLFLCWVHDLLRNGPKLQGGRIYFSVSPQFITNDLSLADDSEYLQGAAAWLFKLFSLVPTQIKQLTNPEDFLLVLSAYLISCEDLEVISIWSPSYLFSVFNTIENNIDELIEALEKGFMIRQGIRFNFMPLTESQRTRLKSFQKMPSEESLSHIFPGLKLISCWAAQNALSGYLKLQELFPDVFVQAKGLLATEAPMTWPSIQYQCDVPMINQVYFEFLDPEGQLKALHEIEFGQEYELIISQKGGLLRYRIGDFVRINGIAKETPCFEFIGRGQDISDLVGEKLSERFLANLARELFSRVYFCVVPQFHPPGYIVLSDVGISASKFEKALRKSIHYHNARELSQLNPVQSIQIKDLSNKLKDYFVEHKNMLRGDIKDRYLYAQESDGALLEYLIKHSNI